MVGSQATDPNWQSEDVHSSDAGSNSLCYWDSSLDIANVTEDYKAGIKPQMVVQAVYERIEAYKDVQPSVWIHLRPIDSVLEDVHKICTQWPDEVTRPPLWGIPFSCKDSINVAGLPTTVGCPALTFTPSSSATIYQKCIAAGAIFIGKTNMEMLATGMTGCRSAFGTLHSTFSKSHIVGGSSSGSAVSVSEGLVSFSLGSDTAGSIRLPALFNGLVGFKPTKGTVSANGVFPACLHQDCVSVLSLNVNDAETVWNVCKGYDRGDLFAKPYAQHLKPSKNKGEVKPTFDQPPPFRFGIPSKAALELCSAEYRRQFAQAVQALQSYGGKLIEIDWSPFSEANELLYNGSFVLERLTILPEGWFDQHKDQLHPVTRQVFEKALAQQSSAIDLFKDLHKQARFKRAAEHILSSADEEELTILVVPTAAFHPSIEEVHHDPIGINSKLGAFAHFANVLDLVGLALPCGSYGIDEPSSSRLPFGVTLLAGCGLDEELLSLGKSLEERLGDLGQDE